jgi:hypothetical protein
MICAINYANGMFRESQKLNSKTAVMNGADKVIEYSPKDIDPVFYDSNKEILSSRRGNGYWLWKPYFIKRTLDMITDNDYLIYADAGAYYINGISLLIKCMEKEETDIMLFSLGNDYIERMWSKRDAFIIMDCDSAKYAESPQCLAGFILMKKSAFTCKFIDEWLSYAQDIRVISDQPNCKGKNNYPDFKENRHDQTVLSLLSKKYEVKHFRDPSCVHSNFDKSVVVRSSYPQIFQLHRMGDVSTIEDIIKKYEKQLEVLDDFWSDNKKIILYGAGRNASKITSYVKRKEMKIEAYTISDDQVMDKFEKDGLKIYYFSHLPYSSEECKILVTIKSEEVVDRLDKEGFTFCCISNEIRAALNFFATKEYLL